MRAPQLYAQGLRNSRGASLSLLAFFWRLGGSIFSSISFTHASSVCIRRPLVVHRTNRTKHCGATSADRTVIPGRLRELGWLDS